MYLIYSQNNTLQSLELHANKIGDAGASGIGAGLAYVTSLDELSSFRIDNGHYQGVFESDLQPKQDVADVEPQQQSN